MNKHTKINKQTKQKINKQQNNWPAGAAEFNANSMGAGSAYCADAPVKISEKILSMTII